MSGPPEASFWNPILRVLEEKASATVSLFDRGDFVCAYGNDAFLIAKEIFRSQSVLKTSMTHRNCRISYVIMNKNQYPRVLKELLLCLQYRVELFRQSDRHVVGWELIAKGSPGNWIDFEDILSDCGQFVSSGKVLAVKICSDSGGTSSKMVAIACCDIQTFTFSVAEFPDSAHLSNFESAIVHLGPKECIICEEKQGHNDLLQAVLKRSDLFISRREKGEFSNTDIIQYLNKLLKFKKNEIPNAAQLREINMTESMCCLGALVRYLKLTSDRTTWGKFQLGSFHLGQFVRLDTNAVKSLELFATSYSGSKGGTVYSFLDRCKTVPGRKLLDQWIRQPLRNPRLIDERLNIVQAFFEDSGARCVFHDLLSSVPDVLRIVNRIIKKKAALQDCHKVYQLIRCLPKITDNLKGLAENRGFARSAFQELLIEPLEHAMKVFGKFIGLVESTLDLEYLDKSFAFRVRPDCDEKLCELDEEISKVTEKINGELEKASEKLKLDSVKLENNAQLGYFFRVTRKDDKSLRNNKSFKVLDTHKGGVRFTSSSLEVLNDRYLELRKEYDVCQQDIVQKILEIASGYAEPLKVLSETLAILDVLVSFSVVASTARQPYCRPVFREEGSRVIQLNDCRHPCLEEQDGDTFIPNSVSLEDGKCHLMIVTGPNMGGKSTYLRQTALSVLMAQIGCFVPCTSATISVVDAIFTRVGAWDSQSKGLSTFMVEMLDSAAILEGATENSLIIIDELGRGTSTYDGFGLAWAIAEYIVTKIRCFCLFATHFHELTALPQEQPAAKNMKVAAYVEGHEFTLLYRVVPGVADESFGVQVANMVKFPSDIVKNAEKKLESLRSGIAVSIQSSNDSKNKLEKMKQIVHGDPGSIDIPALRDLIQSFNEDE